MHIKVQVQTRTISIYGVDVTKKLKRKNQRWTSRLEDPLQNKTDPQHRKNPNIK